MKSWFFLMCLLVSSVARAADDDLTWHRVVGLLQYLEGDYENALSTGSKDELAEQRGFANEVVQALKLEAGAAYRARAQAIEQAINQGTSAAVVTPLLHDLAQEIIVQQGLMQSPKGPPNLVAGAKSFQTACASCHGEKGDGQSLVSVAMNPKPANFLDAQRMETLTPYKVFNTTTFGVSGTMMPPFTAMPNAERWNLAFYIFTLRQAECLPEGGEAKPSQTRAVATLEQLATSTDAMLAQAFGKERLPCLRRAMPSVDAPSSISIAVAGVRKALELSNANQHDQARQAIVDAYLMGVEPIEPTLRARDPHLVSEIENAFTAARLTAQSQGDLKPDVQRLLTVLHEASRQRTAGDFWSVFITALLILLREGFEAAVVVGALLAVLKKMGATDQSRIVHAGWVSALVFSAVIFTFGQHLLAGANREWMETLVSLFAVGMLLYAALWLNARSNMSKFMGELREKMKGVIGSGNAVGLFLIAFTSVGRETLETALFLEGLGGDSPTGAAWGAVAGLGVLGAFLGFVRRVGFVLPMKTLFKASTVMLLVTAVMLIGKGFHGLQELGLLPLAPARFVTLETLGVWPDWLSLGPQVILGGAPLLWWVLKRHKPSPRQSPSTP